VSTQFGRTMNDAAQSSGLSVNTVAALCYLARAMEIALAMPSFLAELAIWSVVLVWAAGPVLWVYLMWKAYEGNM
jgi:hypothetical protein